MTNNAQQVGLIGAIAIGLASMLGAGVFVVFGSAYEIAGQWLFVALFLAGLVAALNSASIYQLARQVDRPGGTYSYARVYRNDTISFVAGFAFVFGKIGSITATPTQDIAMAASVLFFAFAGYARIATLGSEVKDAKRNIPLAIVITLSFVLLLYAILTAVLLATLGDELIGAPAPFVQFFEALNLPLGGLVTVVAVVASLGSILALLAGVSRTAATMGEDRELPKLFEQRNRFGSPWLAEVIIAVGAVSLVAVGNLAEVIGFSSFSVLIYYAIAHYSALGQPPGERVVARVIAWFGLILCVWLAFSVPGIAAEVSALIIVVALGVRRVARR